MVDLPRHLEFSARTLKAEALVSKRPDQRLNIQESPQPVGLIHVPASQANECRLGIFGSQLHSWTICVREQRLILWVFVAKYDEAPPSPACAACHSIFDSQSRNIEWEVESHYCRICLDGRVHHFLDKC